MARERLSAAQARRVALAAQGFAQPRPAAVTDRRPLRKVLASTGLLQIDSVNVLVRAHYMPVFSRLGAYPVELVQQAAYTSSARAPRELFEYWGHEASLLPMTVQPLLRWRMAEASENAWGGVRKLADERPDFIADVLAEVRRSGPLSAGELEHLHESVPRGKSGWWEWSSVKIAMEYLFWAGEITTASRRGFERVYDVPERVIPAAVLAIPTPSRDVAQRELVALAARSLGVATERDLRDYYRLGLADARAAVASLVEDGRLISVEVEGWRGAAYLDPQARFPRSVDARALLSPFDPVVWERERTERLYDFRYRIEIYVPAEKRVHGYYVLPFLLGDKLVARVDLKADRAAGRLLVQGAFAEPSAPDFTAEELAAELRTMAAWLGLSEVVVVGRGDLAPALAAALAGAP